MTLKEIMRSSDMVIGLTNNKEEEGILNAKILKTRQGDSQSIKVGNYFNQAREAQNLRIDLKDIIPKLEEEIPGVQVTTMFGEVIIGVPRGNLY